MKTNLMRQALSKLLSEPGYYRLSISARLQVVHFYIFEVI